MSLEKYTVNYMQLPPRFIYAIRTRPTKAVSTQRSQGTAVRLNQARSRSIWGLNAMHVRVSAEDEGNLLPGDHTRGAVGAHQPLERHRIQLAEEKSGGRVRA